MATSYLATVEKSPDGTTWTAITDKVTVTFGEVAVNNVEVPNLENRVVSSVPGSVKYGAYSLEMNDSGTNYADMVADAAAGTISHWRFTRGPSATGDRTATFSGFVLNVGGPSGDLDTTNKFTVTLKPTSDVTIGTKA